jgi:Fic family protein
VAHNIQLRWDATLDVGIPRRDRTACAYETYVPDPLMSRSIALDGDVAADVADAEAAILRLNSQATTLVDTEALARLLLRAESVASSHIEGLEIGGRRLLQAQAASDLGEQTRDVTAAEVLGNIDAMVWAVQTLSASDSLDVTHLLEVHRRLLVGTRADAHAGTLREEQNWIGGSDYNPCSAEFVPPPPEMVLPLLEDLCQFSNADSLPAVAQAAIAHAQFETIHPFADGNGRVGRALIHMILRRRGIAPRVLPPISLVLATWSRGYVDALSGTRYIGEPDSREAHEGLNRWVAMFASACLRAVGDAAQFEARAHEIQTNWRARLGRVRAGSTADLLTRALPGAPIVTANGAAALINRSFQATNEAIARLEAAEILAKTTVGKRNRAFEAREIIDAFGDLERQLASPIGDTRVERPSRAVPYRRYPS